MIWVRFKDMHSGGSLKERPFSLLYLRASSVQDAVEKFTDKFGHRPDRVTCDTCGEDYTIDSDDDLCQLTGFDRELRFGYPKPRIFRNTTERLRERSRVYKLGRYLEPDEKLPKGWSTRERYTSGKGWPMQVHLAREDVYCEKKHALEYLAKLEVPPWEER